MTALLCLLLTRCASLMCAPFEALGWLIERALCAVGE